MEKKCASTDPGDKRPLKGLKRTRWECKDDSATRRCGQCKHTLTRAQGKKRKLHGNSSQTDLSVYSTMENHPGPERERQENPCHVHIGERLGKLEQLFERFVCRKMSAVDPPEIPRSPTLVDSSDTQSKLSLPMFSSDAQSVSSIGEGIVSLRVPCCRCVQCLRGAAECSDVDVCTVHSHTSREAQELVPFGG